jgi:hypothetical protein
VEFDEMVGLGQIQTEAGQTYPFHCTQIADGSRRIEPGTPVVFGVTAAHLGRWEASAISPVG